MRIALLAAALVGSLVVVQMPAQDPLEKSLEKVKPLMAIRPAVPVPQVDGDWWRITSQPDLGELSDQKQQPVDFAVWQAKDGTWQLWSCIRHTKHPGNSRLFFRWEGRRLTDRDWKPGGVAMRSDPALGEREGGLQAPFVWREADTFYMVYGDWNRICLATSKDGKQFQRHRNERGQPDLFSGPYDNTRDAMVLRTHGLYVCYYTGHKKGASPQCAVFCRTSADLKTWSEPLAVSAGGAPAGITWYGGDCECPFVLERNGTFYLFRTVVYGKGNLNVQYASRNPFEFGVDSDRAYVGWLPTAAPEIVVDKAEHYIVALEPALDGMRVAKLRWVEPGR